MAEWRENQVPTPVDKPEHWTMYFDGSLKLDGGDAGVLLISPRGEQLKYVLQIQWAVSNNEAEYEALLHGLRLAISLGIKRLLVYGDSLLVVQQVNKEWDSNKETMDAYVQEVRKLENKFSGLEVHHVLREHNVGWGRHVLRSHRESSSRSSNSHPSSLLRGKQFRRGSPTTRSRGYGAARGLARGFSRLHPRSKATSRNRCQERRGGTCHAQKQGFCPGQQQALSARRSVRCSHEVRHKGRGL
jgi:ribonuclease HI